MSEAPHYAPSRLSSETPKEAEKKAKKKGGPTLRAVVLILFGLLVVAAVLAYRRNHAAISSFNQSGTTTNIGAPARHAETLARRSEVQPKTTPEKSASIVYTYPILRPIGSPKIAPHPENKPAKKKPIKTENKKPGMGQIVEQFDQTIDLGEKYYGIAVTADRYGYKQQALHFYRKYLFVKPNGVHAAEVRQRLSQMGQPATK